VSDFSIRVTGLKEAQKALYSYSQQMGDHVVIASLKEGAKVMQKQARANAPKITGRLRRGIVVKKSKMFTGRKTPGLLGVFLCLRLAGGRKDPKDAFYGRFVEYGYNSRGPGGGFRRTITSRFGTRTGRKSQPGKTDVPGREFMGRAYNSTREMAAQAVVRSAIAGSEVVARRTGLK